MGEYADISNDTWDDNPYDWDYWINRMYEAKAAKVKADRWHDNIKPSAISLLSSWLRGASRETR